MEFINYFFASIISSLGLLIGFVLINIAPEEQKPLEKYFVLLRKILLLIVFAFLVFYYFNDWIYFVALILLIVFLLFIEYKIKDLSKRETITYSILGILFYLSSKNTNLFVIESSLILLYGLPTASLCSKKDRHKIIFCSIGFVIISNLLFLITTSPF